MIYMETNIVLRPDKEAEYRGHEKDMYRMVEKFGIKVVGSWHTGIGDANEFTILFASEDMGKLGESALAMALDKEYQAVWQKISPLIMSQTRKIMMPMPMSPLK